MDSIEKGISTRRARGFKIEVEEGDLSFFREQNLGISVFWAIFYHLSIIAMAGAMFTAFMHFGINTGIVALYPLVAIFIARQQRGLEVMVHDASHRTWCRKWPWLNDFLANVLVALPSLMTVFTFWEFHAKHHRDFGGPEDPCKRRFQEIKENFESKQWASGFARYCWGFYVEVARKPVAVLRMLAWHVIVYIMPLTVIFGWTFALMIWLVFWLIPQITVLPALRLVAEYEEHDYALGTTEADCTFSSITWLHKWLFHPFSDGYHFLHHKFPAVPHYKLHKLHEFQMERSKQYRESLFRPGTLQRPF